MQPAGAGAVFLSGLAQGMGIGHAVNALHPPQRAGHLFRQSLQQPVGKGVLVPQAVPQLAEVPGILPQGAQCHLVGLRVESVPEVGGADALASLGSRGTARFLPHFFQCGQSFLRHLRLFYQWHEDLLAPGAGREGGGPELRPPGCAS